MKHSMVDDVGCEGFRMVQAKTTQKASDVHKNVSPATGVFGTTHGVRHVSTGFFCGCEQILLSVVSLN